MCIVRSLHTDAINHDPAHTFMNTGSMIAGRPAMGSWLWYGLGNDAQSLPGFVVMVSTGHFGQKQPIAARQWHSGFLPSRFQGVEFRSVGDPVLYLKSPAGVTAQRQREFVDAVQSLNRIENNASPDPEIATRISQYEMAFQMQTSVPELMDVRNEPKHILDLYGTEGGDGTFAVQLPLGADGWPSGASASFSSITATGTITACSNETSRGRRPKSIVGRRPCSSI